MGNNSDEDTLERWKSSAYLPTKNGWLSRTIKKAANNFASAALFNTYITTPLVMLQTFAHN